MRILTETVVKSMFRGKCSVYKKAWEEVDNIVYKMVKDMGNRTEIIVRGDRRGIATIADINKAYNQHRANYEVNMVNNITEQITECIEKIRKGVISYHSQENLPKRTKKE